MAETKDLQVSTEQDVANARRERAWEPVSLKRVGTFGEALVGGSAGTKGDGGTQTRL